jgi:hypothetical protein
MFIDPSRGAPALRQEGHVEAVAKRSRPTSGGHCLIFHVHASWADMALLRRARNASLGSYKHGPPNGGPRVQTAEALRDSNV